METPKVDLYEQAPRSRPAQRNRIPRRPRLQVRHPAATKTERVSFDDWYRSEFVNLVTFVRYAGALEEEAEDAAQQAMLEGYRKWESIRRPWPYLRKAALHNFINARDPYPCTSLDGVAERHDESHLQPIVWEDQDWVDKLLALLPPKQQEAMRLVVKGFTPAEIARRLGATPEAVRQRLLSGRKALKKHPDVAARAPRSSASSTDSPRKEAP